MKMPGAIPHIRGNTLHCSEHIPTGHTRANNPHCGRILYLDVSVDLPNQGCVDETLR